jgi:hypothetical protein
VAFLATAVTFTMVHLAKLSILIFLFYLWWMLVTGERPDVMILVGVGGMTPTVVVAGAVQPDDVAAAAAQGNVDGKAWLFLSRQQVLMG